MTQQLNKNNINPKDIAKCKEMLYQNLWCFITDKTLFNVFPTKKNVFLIKQKTVPYNKNLTLSISSICY